MWRFRFTYASAVGFIVAYSIRCMVLRGRTSWPLVAAESPDPGRMNCAEDESPGVTLDTIGTVTMCQDEHGNLVFRCNDTLQVREGSEPPSKRSRLVTEHDPAIGTSPTATGGTDDFEVSAPPVSDTGVSSTAHSPAGNASVGSLSDIDGLTLEGIGADPVSQTWFTTKEDKDSLYIKGHKWKQGMWSKEETELLIINIESYLKAKSISNAAEVIFDMPKDERKDFYRTIARGLNRPLFAVYRRVLRMYDNRNHVGKYTTEEIEQLKELRAKHRNDWAAIGSALGRSASSVKDRCRLLKDTCNTGKWTVEEEQRLADVVHELTGTTPGEAVTQGVCWADVAERVGTRSEKQCRSKWLNYLSWKQSGGREWTKDDDIELILRIVEQKPQEESEISWEKLSDGWNSVRSPQWLRSKWWTVKRPVTTHKNVPFLDLLNYLNETHIPVLRQMLQRVPSVGPAVGEVPTPTICLQLPRGEDGALLPQTTITTLQIPVQITQTGDPGDAETVTINTPTLQAYEFLPAFHLQATCSPCTFLLQTGSSSGLSVTLSSGGRPVTLTQIGGPSAPAAASPLSPSPPAVDGQQIATHAVPPAADEEQRLQPRHRRPTNLPDRSRRRAVTAPPRDAPPRVSPRRVAPRVAPVSGSVASHRRRRLPRAAVTARQPRTPSDGGGSSLRGRRRRGDGGRFDDGVDDGGGGGAVRDRAARGRTDDAHRGHRRVRQSGAEPPRRGRGAPRVDGHGHDDGSDGGRVDVDVASARRRPRRCRRAGAQHAARPHPANTVRRLKHNELSPQQPGARRREGGRGGVTPRVERSSRWTRGSCS